jgi:prepilin signal peptidase PulO-like enzyme (type II secretory pathway)
VFTEAEPSSGTVSIPRWQVAAAGLAGAIAAAWCLWAREPQAAVAFPLLAVAAIIDFYTARLPDRLTLPALAAALAVAGAGTGAGAACSGAAIGLASGTLIAVLRPRSAGLGDAKLLGALGGAMGPGALALGVAIAAAMALPAGLARKGAALPMGPYFTAGAFAALLSTRLAQGHAVP